LDNEALEKGKTMSQNKIPIEEYQPPAQAQLEAMARDFCKENKPKAYRQMKKDGDLQEVCEMKAKAAMDYAQRLIESGEFPGPAWDRAIRLEILELETD
jgi:hypothetical protein